MTSTRTLAAALALALAAPALAQDQQPQKHLLRFNFKEGAVTRQVMTQELNAEMSMGGQPMGGTKMTMSMFQTYTVKKVKGNTAELEQEITRVKAKADGSMMEVDYDSADEDSDPGMLEGLADILGQKTQVSLDDRGEIGEVKVPEAMQLAQEEGAPDMKMVMSQMITSMPEEPVAIGATWTSKRKMALGMPGDTETEVTYKLLSVDARYIVLEQRLKLDLEAMDLPPGAEIKQASATGKIQLSRATGLPETMTLEMNMEMTGQLDSKMSMKVTLKPQPAAAPKTGAGRAKDAEKKDGEKKDGN